jgi:hypothetical protein
MPVKTRKIVDFETNNQEAISEFSKWPLI